MAISKGASDTVNRLGLAYQMAELDATTLMLGGSNITATAAELNFAADTSANTEIVTTTNVLTAVESGKTLFLNAATGFVTTLPLAAQGLRFTFIIGETPPTSGNHTIITGAGALGVDIIQGAILFTTIVLGADEDTISFVASTSIEGDRVDLISDGTNWYARGFMSVTSAMTFTTAES